MNATAYQSAIYRGSVRHRRSRPKPHAFEMNLMGWWLDLDELPQLLRRMPLMGTRRSAPVRFQRDDYMAPHDQPLADAARDCVARTLGRRPAGPVRLWTQLRIFGVVFNPVSFYFCYEEDGETLAAVIAEITNIPWFERHRYVLPAEPGKPLVFHFDKRFHVSPFLPMDLRYRWSFGRPGERLGVHMRVDDAEGTIFDATLAMQRVPLRPATVFSNLLRYPLLTMRIPFAIYWHALRLKLKGVRFHRHPATRRHPPTRSHHDTPHADSRSHSTAAHEHAPRAGGADAPPAARQPALPEAPGAAPAREAGGGLPRDPRRRRDPVLR